MEAQYWTQCILLQNNTFGTMVVVSSYSSNTSSNSTLPFTYQYHIYLIYGQNLAKQIYQMGSMLLPVGTQHACKNKLAGKFGHKGISWLSNVCFSRWRGQRQLGGQDPARQQYHNLARIGLNLCQLRPSTSWCYEAE
ncbi:hypothetical protein SS50377_20016 [Spironucleus salmonicida]|uniref:Uncharacterized protein n=1 Tax=Spironucleus salmonicida TaxID=348837 RepID=A0A9P8LYK5_9EUKA|nr:hypothetical protein SS50377_20016 [Spironucleus salmonicida]